MRGGEEGYGEDLPGSIRDILLKNINWFHEGEISLEGFGAENMIRNVTFSNCTLAGQPL